MEVPKQGDQDGIGALKQKGQDLDGGSREPRNGT